MVIGDEIPLSWIYALLAGLVVLGVYFVNPDTALALALIFAGIFIAYKGFEFYKMDEKVMAMALFLFGLFVINYGFTGVGLKQTLFQGGSGLIIKSADYLPFAYADDNFEKIGLDFEKAWLINFYIDSYGQYILTRDDLKDEEDGVQAKNSLLISGEITNQWCKMKLGSLTGEARYNLKISFIDKPFIMSKTPAEYCKDSGYTDVVIAGLSIERTFPLWDEKIFCIYRDHYDRIEFYSTSEASYETSVKFRIQNYNTKEEETLSLTLSPDSSEPAIAKANKVGIIVFPYELKKIGYYSCDALEKLSVAKRVYGTSIGASIIDTSTLPSENSITDYIKNYCEIENGIYKCYDKRSDLKTQINEYRSKFYNSIKQCVDNVPGLPSGTSVCALYSFGTVETTNLKEPLYAVEGNMYVDAEWIGIITACPKPELVDFDGNSWSNKVYFEPGQSKSIRIRVKDRGAGGQIKIYVEGCKYLSGSLVTSIGSKETKEYRLIVSASNYQIDKEKDMSCQLCVETYTVPVPVGGECKQVRDCKNFYYHLKKGCVDKCTLGEYKCLDRYTSGKCELQKSGCYDYTPIYCPNGCDYRTGKCKGGNVPVCGNGICETWLGENAQNCPQDCGPVPPREKCKDCFEWLRGRIAKLIGGEAVTVCKPKEFTIKFFGFKIFAISQNIYCPIFFIVIGLIILIVLSYLLPALGFIKEILGSAVKRIGEAGKKLAKKR